MSSNPIGKIFILEFMCWVQSIFYPRFSNLVCVCSFMWFLICSQRITNNYKANREIAVKTINITHIRIIIMPDSNTMSNLKLTSVFRSHPLHMQLDQRNKGANSVLFSLFMSSECRSNMNFMQSMWREEKLFFKYLFVNAKKCERIQVEFLG